MTYEMDGLVKFLGCQAGKGRGPKRCLQRQEAPSFNHIQASWTHREKLDSGLSRSGVSEEQKEPVKVVPCKRHRRWGRGKSRKCQNQRRKARLPRSAIIFI